MMSMYSIGDYVNVIHNEYKAKIVRFEGKKIIINMKEDDDDWLKHPDGALKEFIVSENQIRTRNNFDKLGLTRVNSY
jgi:hypothetical protein